MRITATATGSRVRLAAASLLALSAFGLAGCSGGSSGTDGVWMEVPDHGGNPPNAFIEINGSQAELFRLSCDGRKDPRELTMSEDRDRIIWDDGKAQTATWSDDLTNLEWSGNEYARADSAQGKIFVTTWEDVCGKTWDPNLVAPTG